MTLDWMGQSFTQAVCEHADTIKRDLGPAIQAAIDNFPLEKEVERTTHEALRGVIKRSIDAAVKDIDIDGLVSIAKMRLEEDIKNRVDFFKTLHGKGESAGTVD